MTKYIVRELENEKSYRKGEILEAKNLLAVKRRASARQVYERTVLVIESESGHRLAVKRDGKWWDCSTFEECSSQE
jgi:hypothetical protein